MSHRGLVRAAGYGAVALAWVAMAGSAAAQQQAQQSQPSAAQVQLARDLIEANGSIRAVDGIVPGYLEQIRGMFVQNNPDLIGELGQVINAIRPEFEARRAELVNEIARTYGARFTEAELRELVAFYRTPTGRKFVATLPIVLQESFERMQAWGDRLSAEMVARVRAEMQKKGHTL